MNVFKSCRRDAAIERVRARLNDVLSRRRRLGGDHRLDVPIEQRRAQRVQFALQGVGVASGGRSAYPVCEGAAGLRLEGGVLQLLERERRQKFLRRCSRCALPRLAQNSSAYWRIFGSDGRWTCQRVWLMISSMTRFCRIPYCDSWS